MAKVSLNKDEKKILQGFVHNKAEQKTNYYDKKIAEMKQKYDMEYSAFQNKIYLRAAEIDLEEWNDFVLWGSYVKAHRYWAQFCWVKLKPDNSIILPELHIKTENSSAL